MKDKDEILRLINQGFESRNLDFKRSMPWDETTQYRIIKHILAFANSGGGYIIVGYDEKGVTDSEKRTGIAGNHRSTWETTKVNQLLSSYADPPVDVDVYEVPNSEQGRPFLILDIPEHGSVPHVCKQSKHASAGAQMILRKGATYYRTASKSCEEICDSNDYRELIRRCLINDKRKLLRDFEQILSGKEGPGDIAKRAVKDPLTIMDEQSLRAAQLIAQHDSNME